ncbi:hypothetical protein OG216_38045 [Streptomycetaceae bacterium NBC_01309]
MNRLPWQSGSARAPRSAARRLVAGLALVLLAALLSPMPSARAWSGVDFALPGAANAENSTVASVARGPGHLDVFWIASNGAVNTATWNDTTHLWTDGQVAPPGSAAPGTSAGGLAAVARNPRHLDVFWIRPDGGVSTSWWDVTARGWSPVRSIAPARAAVPGSLAAAARNADQLDVFWIQPNRAIATTTWNVWLDWPAPWSVTAPNAAQAPVGALTVVSRARDHLDLFWVRPDGGVSTAWWNVNANWPSRSIAPAGAARVSDRTTVRRAGLVAVSRRPDFLDVFWIGPDGGIGTTAWNPWANWPSPWPIAWPGAAQSGSLAAVARTPGQLDVAWVTADNRVQSLGYDERVPGGWGATDATTAHRALPGALTMVSRRPDLLDVFWVNPYRTIGTTWRPNERVRVHVKAVNVPLDQELVRSQIADMAFLYGRVEIGVELVGTEQISIPGLDIVRVGPCNENVAPATADQNTLAEHRNGAGPKDIVIYIVPRVRDNQGDINGCATHPAGKPGAVVAPHPRRWLHAHEVGHVLDLQHPEWRVDDHTTLMTGLGLTDVKNPPDINARDKATMFASPLTIP